jgi:hypothetical protein
MACSDHSTVKADERNVDEDESDDADAKRQGEGDTGYGARPGGGFTSVVS